MVCHAINSWFISRANSKVYVVTSHNTDKDILYRAWQTKRVHCMLSLVHGKSADNFYIILSIHGHGMKQLTLGGYSSGFVHIILPVVENLYPMNW